MRREKGTAPAGVTAAAPPCCTGEAAVRVAGAASVGTTAVGAAAGERSCVSVTLTAGIGSVTSGTTAGASGHFCRRRKTLPPPLPKSGSPLPFEVAAGLPPSRFGDRRCFGSAVPSSFEWLWLLRKRVGAEVLTAVDSGQYERSQLASLGCDFNVSSKFCNPIVRTSEDDVLTPLQVIPFQDMEGEASGELCLFSVYSVFLYHRSYYFSLTFIFMKLVRGIGNYDMYNCKLVLCICIYIS
ncbi:uncharacterized protein [Arachis hypogaea]|uniref:uncharacterized protein n=1 Tax=Arachis hypogaea TaxID=3818 RepID=UPI003B20E111